RSPRATFRSKAGSGQQPLERWWEPAERDAPVAEPVVAAHLQEQQGQPRDAQPAAAAPRTTALDLLGTRYTVAPGPRSEPEPRRKLPRSLWIRLLAIVVLAGAA